MSAPFQVFILFFYSFFLGRWWSERRWLSPDHHQPGSICCWAWLQPQVLITFRANKTFFFLRRLWQLSSFYYKMNNLLPPNPPQWRLFALQSRNMRHKQGLEVLFIFYSCIFVEIKIQFLMVLIFVLLLKFYKFYLQMFGSSGSHPGHAFCNLHVILLGRRMTKQMNATYHLQFLSTMQNSSSRYLSWRILLNTSVPVPFIISGCKSDSCKSNFQHLIFVKIYERKKNTYETKVLNKGTFVKKM